MKTINVVAAIIIKDNKIFATQRGYGEFKNCWEFPGGKKEQYETGPKALIREIKEELDTIVKPIFLLHTIEYDYPTFHISMDCYVCSIKSGNLTLIEHSSSLWLRKEDLSSINWLPADLEIIDIIHKNWDTLINVK